VKITIATDSYKGSLTTFQAGEAIKEGIQRVYKNAQVKICPLADGGEGTVETIVSATGGKLQTVSVTGPLCYKVEATYGITGDTAIIEMSSAAGITLVPCEKRNPLNTTTYGIGELILDAMSKGCKRYIIGIGGSSTNDGGVGMLQALGFEFLNGKGQPIPLGAKGLQELAVIRGTDLDLTGCEFRVACDVTNPLCGENGCSVVYGPQKGATPEMIQNMDEWLLKYAELTKTLNPDVDASFPGAGAAGGLGFAFMSYLNGTLEPGTDLVIKATGLENFIKDTDIVVTGEGRLDGQTVMGKAPMGVAELAKKYGKLVIAFGGSISDDATECNRHGIDAFFSIVKGPCSLEEAMNYDTAYKNLSDTAEQVFRLLYCNGG